MIINFIKFSTSDTAILAFWLVHCISVTSYYTYIWPCVEINAANAKFFVGSQVSSTKKWMRKTEANSVSCLKKKHKKLRTMPSQKQRNGHKVRNKNIQRYVSFMFPLKVAKFQIWTSRFYAFMKITVTATTIFTTMLLNSLLVLVAPIFRNRRKKCQKKNWMFLWRDFARLRGRKWYTVSLQKFINEIHLRAAIANRFLRSLPRNKRLSVISDPAFTEANKALEHLKNTSGKRGTLLAY